MDVPTEPSPAPTPWDASAKADPILRTSDNVDFRIRRSFLAFSSDVFDGIFSLPEPILGQKRKTRDEAEYVDDIPVIPISETKEVLTIILAYCYPMTRPKLSNPRLLSEALVAARKYMMSDYIETELCKQFEIIAEKFPVQSYAYASQHHWKEMQVAAKASLLSSFDSGESCREELEKISAATFSKLIQYRQACVNAAMEVAGYRDETRAQSPRDAPGGDPT